MKFSFSFLLLILFFGVKVKSQQYYSGVVPLGCKLDTLSFSMLTAGHCSTSNHVNINLDQGDTTVDFSFYVWGNCSNVSHGSACSFTIDSSFDIAGDFCLGFIGYPNYYNSIGVPYGTPFTFLKNGNLNASGQSISLTFCNFYLSANGSYMPIRKKYGSEYIIGFAKVYSDGTGGAHSLYLSIGEVTKFPTFKCIYDTIPCGTSYTFADGLTLTNMVQDTVYEFVMPSTIPNCDSLVRTRLKVLPQYVTPLLIVNDTVCGGQTYNFPGGGSLLIPLGNGIVDTQINATLNSISGCDSADVQLNVRIENPTNKNIDVPCTNNYTLPNGVILTNVTLDSIYHFPGVSQNGCLLDTFYHINANNTSLPYTPVTVPCGSSYTFPDNYTVQNITSAVGHIDTVSQYTGCMITHYTYVTPVSSLNPVIISNGYYMITSQPYLTYQWYKNGVLIPGATSCTYHALQMADYTVMVNDSMGCPATSAPYWINTINPQPNLTTVSICSNQLPYLWNGQSITNSGTYSFLTTNVNGCDSTALLNLTVKPVSSSTTTHTICANQTPYVWNGQSLSTSGIYSYVTINNVGCDSTAYLNLTVKPVSSSTTIHNICSNQTPYVWNSQNLDTSGTYSFVTNNNVGCDSTAYLNLTVYNLPNPIINVSGFNLTTSSSFINHQWYLNGSIITGATNSVYLPLVNGMYEVQVTDSNGCSNNSAPYSFISVSTMDFNSTEGMYIYPNPTSGILHIANSAGSTRKNLFNTLGQLILTTDSNEIDLSALAAGLYYLRYEDKVWKVVKD